MRIPLLMATLPLLASCATYEIRPYRVGIDSSVPIEATATIWADNAMLVQILLAKVDTQKILPPGSGWSPGGGMPPYSVATAPGAHSISVQVWDYSDFNPFAHGAKHANIDLPVVLEAGHSYALRHKNNGNSVSLYLVDLGINQSCEYIVAGNMRQGYTPVTLTCK